VKRGKPDSVGRPEQPLVNPYHVNPHPCSSCPYAKSTPPGVWAEHEYEKLRRFDEGYQFIPEMSTFLCHQAKKMVKRLMTKGIGLKERDQ